MSSVLGTLVPRRMLSPNFEALNLGYNGLGFIMTWYPYHMEPHENESIGTFRAPTLPSALETLGGELYWESAAEALPGQDPGF